MSTKYQKVSLNHHRLIILSDIHGELTLFKKVLTELNFNHDDILIIVGDISEKGENSLGLLDYIIELQNHHHVYAVVGNCDTFYEDVEIDTPQNDTALLGYMLKRKASILNEMCQKLGIIVDEKLDMPACKKALRDSFKQEFAYLKNLPTIIESEDYIFVHAALEDKPLNEQDFGYNVTTLDYLNKAKVNAKTVIVGHYPTANYSDIICDNNIIFENSKHIIALDGGMNVKTGGQLNVLVINTDQSKEVYRYDNYPKIIALDQQKASSDKYNLSWPNTEIEIISQDDQKTYATLIKTGEKRYFKNSEVYHYRGKDFCTDVIKNRLAINKGDNLSLVEVKDDRTAMVLKNGIYGEYTGKYLKK